MCDHRYNIKFIDCCLDCGATIKYDDLKDDEKEYVKKEALDTLKGFARVFERIEAGENVFERS